VKWDGATLVIAILGFAAVWAWAKRITVLRWTAARLLAWADGAAARRKAVAFWDLTLRAEQRDDIG